MCDIEKKYAVLLAYVQDVANRGGRFDTHPTMEHSTNTSKTHADYQHYLCRINLGMKEGAQFVLNQVEAIERKPKRIPCKRPECQRNEFRCTHGS